MTQGKPLLPNKLSAILRYGLAVLFVATALGIDLLLGSLHVRGVEFPFFLVAITLAVWYAGTGPGILALVLSTLAFNYYFTEPIYSFYITWADLPYYLIFILFALLITWFTTLRRRIEINLVQSRDELQREVATRTQQANLLNLTHDAIFVRDMSDVITYWNPGANELFGWREEQAIGQHAHELLRTIFPIPFDQIYAELLRTGRWEGELEKTKSDGIRVSDRARSVAQCISSFRG
jgi:PAS domain S-box-containing protein